MGKILVYVDAENVSKNQVSSAIRDARILAEKYNAMIIGKFYGAQQSIGSLVSYYCSLGLEYVDTSIYSENKKNLTDMKIIVDSTWDVLGVYRGDVKAVYLLSNDCDYNPLICKFKAIDLNVYGATFDEVGELETIHELTQFLKLRKFYPVKKEFALRSLYDALKSVAEGVFLDDELLLTYARIRVNKLIKATFERFKIVIDEPQNEELKTFKFNTFNKILHEYGYEDDISNFQFYTTRIFGSSLSRRDVDDLILHKG